MRIYVQYKSLSKDLNHEKTKMENEIKKVEQIENANKCFMDKDHSNQKFYRTSVAIWTTIPAMEKIQKVFGVTEETINATKAFIMIANKLNCGLVAEDLNRNPEALKTPEAAQNDATPLNKDIEQSILNFFKAKYTQEQIIQEFVKSGYTLEQIKPYFKPQIPQPQKPILKIPTPSTAPTTATKPIIQPQPTFEVTY